MTTNTSPSPNFSGINFNAEFFSSSSTYLTEEEANLLYLNKTVPDTANVLETFTVGISATAIGANTASIDFVTSIGTNTTYVRSSGGGGALTICDNTTTGNLDIGTGTTRSGTINIGNGVGATGYIDIGNVIAPTRIGGPLETTGLIVANGNIKTATLDCNDTSAGTTALAIGPNAVNGNIVIGSALGVGDVSIGGSQSIGGTITLGSANTLMTLNGIVNATTELNTPILDCITDASAGSTSLSIGPSAVNGDIVIGASLGVGDVSIGVAQGVGGTITLGSVNTVTTLNGIVNATTDLNTPILDCITDAGAGSTSLSIGPSAVNGNIIIGAALGVGDVSIGGSQSTGGTITLGSASSATTNAGSFTVGVGTSFRCVIMVRNAGSTSAASGTITIPGAPSAFGNPLVFASLNITTTNNPYFLNVNPTATNTFTYYKTFYNRSGTTFNNAIVGATGETFNYIAIWL
jgi:hypothetical protein